MMSSSDLIYRRNNAIADCSALGGEGAPGAPPFSLWVQPCAAPVLLGPAA